MGGFAESQGLKPPEDESIVRLLYLLPLPLSILIYFFRPRQTSLFLSSLPASATDTSIRTAAVTSLPALGASAIRSVVHVARSRCAFVNFVDRAAAEAASQAWAAGFEIDGQRVNVKWGRSRPGKGKVTPSGGDSGAATPEPPADAAS